MTRARATALALVNWKGVFYERYLLDRHVTALEGANGAGKTTVMIAAYVVLLPDMTRLRFTNLGESGAVGGDRHRVVEIHGAVRTDGGRGSHGAHEHDGLVAFHDQVEKVAGLLGRVRAVRDHDAVGVLGGEHFIEAVGELEPHLVVHVLAADVDDLLAGDVGDVLHLWYGVDEILDVE